MLMLRDEPLGLDRRLAAHAGSRYRLPVNMIRDIARHEDTGNIRPLALIDYQIPHFIQLELVHE